MPATALDAEPIARLELQPHTSRLKAPSDPPPPPRAPVPWTELTGARRIKLQPQSTWADNWSRLATWACGAGCLGLLSAYVVAG